MSDETAGISGIAARLKAALDVETDAELAERLGFSPRAWSQRKSRGSVPTHEIDALITAEELSADYVYKGIGGPHLPVDGVQSKAAMLKKLRQVFEIETYSRSVVALGYKRSDLQRVLDGQADVSWELLRDLRRTIKVDLHAMLCDELPVTPEELALIEKYRRSPLRAKRAIEAVAEFGSNPEPPLLA